MPVDLDFRIGIVDDRRAFAEAVAAANPRHAKRILGKRTVDKAVLTAPIVLAGKQKLKHDTAPKYPWTTLQVGEWFDVLNTTHAGMAQQARNAFGRLRKRFGVAIATNSDGHTVIRVTRVT